MSQQKSKGGRRFLDGRRWIPAAGVAIFAIALHGTARISTSAELSGKVVVNGSSTVAPISMQAAEMFGEKYPNVRVTVGISGTGGGFKKFLDESPGLRTDINDASRPISQSEMERAKSLGVEYIEIPIALDGMAVIVHPSNNFVEHLTVAELKKIWEPGSKINNWKEVRAGFPDLPMKLYGPGTDSGTFDYFTEAINGKEKACRSDFTGSENDNVLVQGIAGDKGSLGYFGFSYYEANRAKLKLVAVDPGEGRPLAPSIESIRDGSYRPLARPLFLYVNKASLTRPEVRGFLEYVLDNAKEIVEHPQVQYVTLSDALYNSAKKRLQSGKTGSVFPKGPPATPKTLAEFYKE